ncbi:MAG: hypothetical protein LC437_03355 [Thiohalomonas sp.]|nr:hypothetical protein [Thiohalomonas sp.]
MSCPVLSSSSRIYAELKTTATQLNYNECWRLILAKAMEKFKVNLGSDNYVRLPAPS